ncbi:MAG: hypothetical protein WAP07_09150, partial [Acutalibacteraceae bacterium]
TLAPIIALVPIPALALILILAHSFLCSPKKRIKERRHGGNPLLSFQSVFPRDPHPVRWNKI